MLETILIVDDEREILATLGGIIEDEGYKVLKAVDGESALSLVERHLPDLVILDIWMPGTDGMEVLRRIKERFNQTQVVMISGHGNIETAVRATKLGAYDFIEKPLDLNVVVLTVERALEMKRLASENQRLRENLAAQYHIVGKSFAVEELLSKIDLAAPTDSFVLITGENGTGKELAARQIHMKSKRAKAPFIAVNCAAIPEELIESELFGHEKGAFTHATSKKLGKFDLADMGTIFLDEIGDMSLKTQAKVLRILQEQTFDRVGSTEPVKVNVRVIAATNKDLFKYIEEGKFREDLYYRLNVIPIHVPALRERLEDIPELLETFIAEIASKSTLIPKRFSTDAVKALSEYDWPGNVRELKNIIERLMIMVRADEVTREEVVSTLRHGFKQEAKPQFSGELFSMDDFRQARLNFERQFLERKLEMNDGNISRTAEQIGLERSHLHRKIKALGIEVDEN